MLNQIVLVGRIIRIIGEERKKYTLKIAVSRSFKNQNGEYDTDIVPIILWNALGENTKEYCKKGDLIGVKGRIQNNNGKIEIIADKVTFLSSKKEEE